MAAPAAAGRVSALPPAGLDRRFYAYLVDRLIAWPLLGLAVYLAWHFFLSEGATAAGVGVIVGAVLLLWLVFAALLARQGSSPGKSLMGLRVVQVDSGAAIGLGPALLRTLVLGVAALPTFGLGVATLAQTAVMDPSRQRRGWHDHLSRGVVVDVRPVVEQSAQAPDEAPRQVVNLTAMRLAPVPVAAPTPTPPRRPVPPAPSPSPSPGPVPDAPSTPPHRPPVSLPPGAPPGRTPFPPGAPPGRTSWPPGPPPGAPPPTPPPTPARREVPVGERTVVRGAPGQPPTPVAAGWRVTFDTGESFLVEGLTLVGRKPESRPGEPVRHLVALPSQDMSLSKTHAQVQVASDGVLVVVDRGSTNGSMLVRSGVARDLPPGKSTTLLAGDLVRFGDRSMTVEREP